MEERTEERREDEEIDWPQDEDQPELSEPEDQGVESKDKKAEHDDQEGCQEQGEEPGDRKASKPPEDLIEDRKQDVKFPSNQIVALPFLTSISPAGFMSASLKRGKDDNCVQVNGKLYPLAKVQLGRMGALHPANRLAAYLTGRVGGSSRPLSSASPLATASPLTSAPNTILPTSTASTTVGPNQSSARPKPESVAGSGSGSGSGPKPSVPTFPPGSQVNVRPPPPQVLMIQVPGPSSAPLQQIVPISSGSLATIPPFSLPLSALTSVAPIAPVTSTTLPLSTLTPAPSLPSGSTPFSSLTPVAPVASVSSTSLTFSTLTPAISFPSSSIPLTSLTPIAPVSSGSNPISSLMPVTPVAPVAPVSSGSLPLAQTRTVLVPQVGSPQTLQISGPALSGPALSGPALSGPLSGPGGRLFRTPDGRLVQLIPLPQKPTSSMIHNNKHMIIYRRMKNKRGEVTLVPVTGQSAASSPGTVNPASSSVSSFVSPKSGYSFKFFPEKSTKEKVVVRTSEVVPNPAHVLKILTKTSQNQPKTSEKQPKNTNQTRSEEEEEPRSVFKGAEEGQGVEEELAVDLNDLDVICVDGEDEQRREEQRREEENQDAVVIVDSSSEETENSSDYNSGDDETHQKKKDLGRKIHNLSEKIRRHEMDNLFQTLRKEVGLEDPLASRKLTLNKAQALIQDLRTTEKHLRSLKLRLRSSRDGLLNRLLPHTEEPAVQALLREHRRRKDSMVPREDDVIEVIDLQRAKPRRRRANQAEDGQMDVKVQRQLKTLITDQSSEVSLEEEQQNLQEELQSTNPTPAKTATSSPAKAPPHTVTSFPTNVPPLHAVTSSPTKTAASPSKVPVTKSSSPIKTMTSSPAKAPPPHAVTSSPVTLIITQNSTLRQRTVPNILSRRKTSASSAYSQKEGPQMQTVLPPRFVMTSSSLPAPMFQGQVLPRQQLVPAQVLPPRQVRPPCQQVVTLQPVLPSPAIATVALNLSNNQQLSSGHRLSPGDLITCSAPLPISNPGGELNLVHLVSPQKASTLPSPKPQLPSAPAATSAPPTVTQTPPTGPPPSKDPSPLVAGPTKITDPPPSPKSLSPQKAAGQSQTLQLPSDSAPTAPTEQQFPSVPAPTAPTELQLPSTLAPTAPTELHLPSATAQRKIKTILKHIPHPTSKKTFSKKETVQSPKLQLPSAPPPTETTDPPSCPLPAAPVQPQPSSPTVHQSEPTPQRSESAAFSLDNSQRHSSLIQSEPSLASLLSEIAFLNQNSKTSPNQSPGPALAPLPLVKLSSSSSISREKANHSSGGGAWRPMPKLRRL
ncbi:hypothetical protein NQD34_016604 [Periophthalmus magnuspinnatus]|nr:hypothetical protein NQD34_016604 [Periophthalmus magnuspinnatus]